MKPKPSSTRGSVLIVVLIICLGLVSLTLVFSQSMLMSYRGGDNDLAGRQAEAAVLGGEQYAEALMANAAQPGVLPDRTAYQNAAVPLGDDARFWFIGAPLASDPVDKPAFGLVDEASKLNLNTASMDMLALLPGMTLELALAIRTWRSTQGTSGLMGTTTEVVKSAPFESPGELALVGGGLDPSLLYGDDANFNHCLDLEEGNQGGTGVLGRFNPGLLEYVTVFSREPNTMPDGTKRANVLAGINGLRTALTTALGSTTASTAQTAAASGGSARVDEIFRRLGRTARFRSVVDFCIQAQLTADEWDKVTPYLTMGGGQYTQGLVNVNTASAAVLACLPNMTDSLAAKLVDARPQPGTTAATNLQWIVPILGNDNAARAGRYLTTRSYQVSADVAAVGRHGRGYRRTLFVLDTSASINNGSTTPQIVYRRNLGGLGWALGSDARTAATAATTSGGSATP